MATGITARTRFLARVGHGGVLEYIVLEVEPDGQQVKLKPLYGDVFWAVKSTIHVVEILPNAPNTNTPKQSTAAA